MPHRPEGSGAELRGYCGFHGAGANRAGCSPSAGARFSSGSRMWVQQIPDNDALLRPATNSLLQPQSRASAIPALLKLGISRMPTCGVSARALLRSALLLAACCIGIENAAQVLHSRCQQAQLQCAPAHWCRGCAAEGLGSDVNRVSQCPRMLRVPGTSRRTSDLGVLLASCSTTAACGSPQQACGQGCNQKHPQWFARCVVIG